MRRGPQAKPIRLGFHGSILNDRNPRPERVLHPSGTLLDDVGQLVAEKLLPVCGVRVVLSGSEIEIRAVREGDRADRRCLRADMDSDIRKAGVEKRLHFLPHGVRQRLTHRAAEVRQVRRQLKRLAIGIPLHDRSLRSGTARLHGLRVHAWCMRQDRLRQPLMMRQRTDAPELHGLRMRSPWLRQDRLRHPLLMGQRRRGSRMNESGLNACG
jgi:hypothetical protein